jgi:tetratricopeptide (TPR) repeat protein
MSFLKNLFDKKSNNQSPDSPEQYMNADGNHQESVGPSVPLKGQQEEPLPISENEKPMDETASLGVPVSEKRSIRVFISSTFKDMMEERDQLVKFVFPQIKKLCFERQVVWGEVDLRWGITEEQKAEGKVLPICLQEIKKCRPYFIGVLGERYGWVPEEIESDIADQEPWLKINQNRSVTELEIMQGVLNEPNMAQHAYFYFRSREYIQRLSPELRKDYIEIASDEEINKYGSLKAASLVEDRKVKLAQLKEKIRKSRFSLRENYPDPKAFGELVLEDLTNLINRLFPLDTIPDTLEREANIHDNFALNRCRFYIGGENYISEINSHIESFGSALIITGESGMGKSTLLSNWAIRYKEANPTTKVFMHFIGISNYSSELIEMLKRIIGDLCKHFDIPFEIPTEYEKIKSAFAECLYKVSTKGKCIIILDALNKLVNRDKSFDLGWLPLFIPPNISVIISTLPGKCLDILKLRDWPLMTLKPFSDDNKRQFIHGFLEQYCKSLADDVIIKIVSNSQTSNPLFLQTILDELRIYGDHLTLEERCDDYLKAKDPIELFRKLFTRYESDYEKERPGLIEDTLTAIWASRHGLSEDELLCIAQTGDKETLRLHWSRFFIPAEHLFMFTSGLLNFSYDYLRTAVECHYLTRSFVKSQAHLKIADYFTGLFKFLLVDTTTGMHVQDQQAENYAQKLIWASAPERLISEIGWQYFKAEQWNRLYDLLSNTVFHAKCYSINSDETKIYWTSIQNNTDLSFKYAYQDIELQLDTLSEFELDPLSKIAKHFGNTQLSLLIQDSLINKSKSSNDQKGILDHKLEQAWNYHTSGQDSKAFGLLNEVEEEGRKIQAMDIVQRALIDHSLILHLMGDFQESLNMETKAELLCRETNDRSILINCLYSMASNLDHLGRYNEAFEFLNESMSIAKEINDISYQILILGELAHNYLLRKKFREALEYISEKENLCVLTGNIKSLANAYSIHASILSEDGNNLEALKFLKLNEEKNIEIGSLHGIATSKLNLGIMMLKMNSFDQVEQLLKDSIERFSEIGDTYYYGKGIMHLSILLNKTTHYNEALNLCNEAIIIFIKKHSKKEFSQCFELKLSILGNLSRVNEIWSLIDDLKHQIRDVCKPEEISDLEGTLGIDSLLKKMKTNYENEEFARKSGNQEKLLEALLTQASMIVTSAIDFGNIVDPLINEAEDLSRQMNNDEGLSGVFYLRGKILNNSGHYEESMINLSEALTLAQEAKSGFFISLICYEKGLLYKNAGNLKEAVSWIKISIVGFKNMQMLLPLSIAEGILKELETAVHQIPQDPGESLENNDATNNSPSIQPENIFKINEINDAFENFLEQSPDLPGISKLRTIEVVGKQRIMNIIQVFHTEGSSKRALTELKELSDYFIKSYRLQDFCPVLVLIGTILTIRNQFKDAVLIFEEMEGVCMSLKDNPGVALALHNQATSHRKLNNLKDAISMLQKEEKILLALNDNLNLQLNYKHQSEIFKISGRMDLAASFCGMREKICLAINEKKGLADSYNNHGSILSDLSKPAEALHLFKLSEKIQREIGDKDGLQISLGNQALAYYSQKNYSTALEICNEKESICIEIDNQKELAVAYGIKAITYLEMGEPNEAFEYFNREEEICREINAEDRLQISLGNKAGLFTRYGKYEESLPLLKEKENICRKHNIAYGLSLAIMNQAAVLYYMGHFKESYSYANEAKELIEKHGYVGFILNINNLIKEIKSKL